MVDFVTNTVIISLLACWAILTLGKTGVREYVVVHASRLVSEMFGCDFCLSWWTCLLFSAIFSITTGDASLLLCAFCAAPLTRHIIA